MQTNIKRTGLNITTYCNLNCKHCLAFIPYYETRSSLTLAEAQKVLEVYFKVVDTVEHFTVTGGEPLLNQDVGKILEEVYKYREQISVSIDFVTNGTMEIPEEILDMFERHKEKMRIVLSDYGEELSVKINYIEEKLKKRGITYRISKFYGGGDWYYGGWIDFNDHSLKWNTLEERERNAQKCIHRVGKYFAIYDGELHCCSRSYWRIRNQMIPKVKGEYVPLLDDTVSLEEKRRDLIEMNSKKSSSSCAYCVGLCNDAKRVEPAQQL